MEISRVSNNLINNIQKIHTNIDNQIDFKEMISDEINKVNNMQINADRLTDDFISGQVDDLHTVMIATEEARLAIELAVQVRNKVVEAYKEINNMQL
ncbi:flagellar hook-basal body complex protein FliE [Tissierella sp. Yu-01]|uniref:flagellar hook-basal body complex protein FliE n=1 Tax=Tissierella sp. Yu-01 TaxID=3035694 RepID=UPI00240DC04C|nr:flagellar hook-basal body complex protein FliE [Tissierella sp. Yu-01]WFA07902.1 flagellar hook-basal body complex protein FliE [Tissierella sp. Yu-01]